MGWAPSARGAGRHRNVIGAAAIDGPLMLPGGIGRAAVASAERKDPLIHSPFASPSAGCVATGMEVRGAASGARDLAPSARAKRVPMMSGSDVEVALTNH